MSTELVGHRQDQAAEALGSPDAVAHDVPIVELRGSPDVEGELLDVVLAGQVAVEHWQGVGDGVQP